jgi:hypothetical protein
MPYPAAPIKDPDASKVRSYDGLDRSIATVASVAANGVLYVVLKGYLWALREQPQHVSTRSRPVAAPG